jgi:hypothetical protein
MSQYSVKQFLILVGAMIINIFLVWYGAKLLFAQDIVSDTQLFLLGCANTIGGVFALSSSIKFHARIGTTLIIIAVYFFARSDGIIQRPWLVRLLGLASIFAAAILLYVALPPNNDRKN